MPHSDAQPAVSLPHPSRLVTIHGVPLTVEDSPRFHHRGLLIGECEEMGFFIDPMSSSGGNTTTHLGSHGAAFLPVVEIERVLDAMSYAKLNVLSYIHTSPSLSTPSLPLSIPLHPYPPLSPLAPGGRSVFPIETPSFPRLWEGAFSQAERYTLKDAKHIVRYAAARGIVVIPEIDTPAHATSWEVGYPVLYPSPGPSRKESLYAPRLGPTCKESRLYNLPPSYAFLNSCRCLLTPVPSVLTGGVGYPVLYPRPHPQRASGGVGYPVLYPSPTCKEPLDVSNDFTFELIKGVLTDLRMNQQGMQPRDAVRYFSNRVRSIALELGWEKTIVCTDPTQHLVVDGSVPEHLLEGGEVCMWGEKVDSSDFMPTIWPRAAAAAGEMKGKLLYHHVAV
ncbi:unnamed protein product [Closterium sp. NIES-64]|nr:unnamed protein product [Closterium sp. NIES-64]